MPLLDHFHAPLAQQRQPFSFLAKWAVHIADALNGPLLATEYFAETVIRRQESIEVDVTDCGHGTLNDPVIVDAPSWALSSRFAAMPAVFPDDMEVRVFSESGGPTLVAAVELVSPRNKDRPEARRSFAAKCAAYLQRGIGVVVVDIVTERLANLHNELAELMGHGPAFRFPSGSALYTTAYHPVRRRDRDEIDMWAESLAVGQPLPTMPLPVRGLGVLPLDLEATYTEARLRSRLG
jgi:hypothetical protein